MSCDAKCIGLSRKSETNLMQLWQRIAAQNGRLEIAMADFSYKPARSAQVQELTFEQLLDSDEAAALLRIHPKTLQKMARNGEINGVQVGRLWRFRASVLNEWLEHKMAS